MPTVSNGAPTNAALEGRCWRTSLNLTSLSLIVAHPPTLHPATASFSAIDLSITHPSLCSDFCWQTDPDLHGSDHCPIVITTDIPSPSFSKPTWKLHKADCAAFSHQAASELCTDSICSAEDPVQKFTVVLINVANNSIPKSKPNIKHNTIWCNEDCKTAIKTRNKVFKQVQKHPTQQNIENYGVIWAQTRRVIKTSKRHSWQTYISKINSRTSIKKFWSMVRKIAGKSPSCIIKHMNVNNTIITEISDIANSSGQSFSNNSSSNNYSTKFQAFRNQAQNQHLKFKSNNLETYSNPFSLDEFWHPISQSHDSAVGPDDIHYQRFKHLPPMLLTLFSRL